MWVSGNHMTRTSSGPNGNVATLANAFATTLAWLNITPFGSPVVPDVYRNDISESGEQSADGSSAHCGDAVASGND